VVKTAWLKLAVLVEMKLGLQIFNFGNHGDFGNL